MQHTGFPPVGPAEEIVNTSSGSYGTPEPDAKKMLTERGSLTTQAVVSSIPLACAVVRKASVERPDNAARAVSDGGSVSSQSASVTSSTMLEKQAKLQAKRDLARARKEAAENRALEIELDAELAAISSSRKSSIDRTPRVSRRTTPAGSVVGSPSRASRSSLNFVNLQEFESQSSSGETPMDLLNQHAVPMMPAVCATIAEDSFRGDVPGESEDTYVVDEVAAEALVRQTFKDFEIARQAQLEEDRLAQIDASVDNAARAACAVPPVQVEMHIPTSTASIPDKEMVQPAQAQLHTTRCGEM